MLFPAKFVLPGGMYWRSIVNFLLKALDFPSGAVVCVLFCHLCVVGQQFLAFA